MRWIEPEAAEVEDVIEVIDRCPSFALGYRAENGRMRIAPSE
jgi:uncharacterized Fe-S cluster protein YjdI